MCVYAVALSGSNPKACDVHLLGDEAQAAAGVPVKKRLLVWDLVVIMVVGLGRGGEGVHGVLWSDRRASRTDFGTHLD